MEREKGKDSFSQTDAMLADNDELQDKSHGAIEPPAARECASECK